MQESCLNLLVSNDLRDYSLTNQIIRQISLLQDILWGITVFYQPTFPMPLLKAWFSLNHINANSRKYITKK